VLVRERFPHLKIFARARSRQHAFALMDAGVQEVIRETYGSSLMAAAVAGNWGNPRRRPAGGAPLPRARRGDAARAVRGQGERGKVPGDSREAAEQLEKLFGADRTTKVE
jgi:glutathione-regulated potassium-efflux system ancillary protein KefC/glutathione-regulated potassium-efflux system protein KefB